MLRNKKYLPGIILLLVLTVTFFSCSRVNIETMTGEELFQLAQNKFNKKDYRNARQILVYLKRKFPDFKYIADVRLLHADAYYNDGNYSEALVQYEIFLKYHPADKKADYASYQRALCKNREVNKFDRDQEPTRMAIKAFQKVVDNFPNSIYAEKSSGKIKELRNILIQHEIYVGKYYLHTKEYAAAIERFKFVLENYKNMGFDTQSMYFLILTYLKSGQVEKAQSVFRNLDSSYTADKWVKKASEVLEKFLSDKEKQSSIMKSAKGNAIIRNGL